MTIKKLFYLNNIGYKHWFSLLLILLVLNFFIISSDPEANLNSKSFFILISLGIIISVDNIDKKFLKPTPSLSSIILAISLLLLVFSNSLFDNYIYRNLDQIMTPLIILSSALLNKPIKYIFKFYKTFLISTTLFFSWYFYKSISIVLAPISTISSWFFLNIFINNVQISLPENYIIIEKNIIEVLGPCSGIAQLFSVLSILIIYLLEFNILKLLDILKMILLAILLPVSINIFRIILLTLITISQLELKQNLFDFFHVGLGSVIFSLLACTFFTKIYFSFVNKELINIKTSKLLTRF